MHLEKRIRARHNYPKDLSETPNNIHECRWALGLIGVQKTQIEKQTTEEHPVQVYNNVERSFLNIGFII
jgi:hypothetical protein